jgi:esterase/lipase
MALRRVIYEIETNQGMASLYHITRTVKGPPILFLHGFGSNADIWFKYKDSLGIYFQSKGYDCWSLDLSNAIIGNIHSLANEDLWTAISFIYEQKEQPILLIAHSMGGIICRVLASPNFEHPFALATLEPKLRCIALLTVPNHGVEGTDIKKLEDLATQIKQVLKIKTKISPDFDLGFVQLLSSSALIQQLNSLPILNPNIHWLNAVGRYDHVVPVKSASFTKAEVKNISFEQRVFGSDHMVFPFSHTLQKITEKMNELTMIFGSSFQIYPAIHRTREVGEWIIDRCEK